MCPLHHTSTPFYWPQHSISSRSTRVSNTSCPTPAECTVMCSYCFAAISLPRSQSFKSSRTIETSEASKDLHCVCSKLLCVRAERIKLAPRLANSYAKAWPIPEDAPVIHTLEPWKSDLKSSLRRRKRSQRSSRPSSQSSAG